MRFALAFCALLAATPASANDGYAGLGAGGLEFGKSDSIEMLSEDLYLSRSRVSVDYVFRGAKDEAVVIAFQLPPLAPGDAETGMALPQAVREAQAMNYLDFTATVNGKAVKLQEDVSYHLPNPEEPYLWGLAALERPGKDVTARMRSLGAPESYDLDSIRAWYSALPAKDRKTLLQEGVFLSGETGPAPNYLVSVRYYWEQLFKAGQDLKIHHDYTPVTGGSVYYVSDEMIADFCIDAGTRKAMDKVAATAMADNSGLYVLLADLEYVLRTANTWKGSIGRFRMTLDKEDPKAIVSLCADGLKKTSPTTFVLEKANYNPSEDIRVLFTAALPIE
jgi:hypothetical protein